MSRSMDSKLIAFFLISAVLTITPGVDMALVTRNTLRRGRVAAFATTLGVTSGLPIHAFLSSVGLSVLLSQSAQAFEVVKLLGAGYLLYLGIRTFISAGRGDAATDPEQGAHGGSLPPGGSSGFRRSYMEGLTTNLLNPKVALFYLTFLPQFIQPGDPVVLRSLLLASIHAGLGILWLTTYAYFVSKLSALLNRPRIKRNIERVTGAVLVGFGVRLLADHQS